jgi:hypothetical protein
MRQKKKMLSTLKKKAEVTTSCSDVRLQLTVCLVAGYKAAFAKLAYAGSADLDPFPHVADAKPFLATQLHALATQHPGQVAGQVPADVQGMVQGYLQVP